MMRFKKIKDIPSPELMAQFLTELVESEDKPWDIWFFKKYCETCPKVKIKDKDINDGEMISFTFCELNPRTCRAFDFMPNSNIKATLWLESEAD